jgi:hypothetical protein
MPDANKELVRRCYEETDKGNLAQMERIRSNARHVPCISGSDPEE